MNTMSKYILLTAALVWCGFAVAEEPASGEELRQDISALVEEGLPIEQAVEQAIAELVEQGMAIDAAVEHALRENPGKVVEIERAAMALMKTMPYGGSCDDCNCAVGSAIAQYPIEQLEESVEKPSWIKEVVDRYEGSAEELMLPNFGENNLFPFFYHFMASLDEIRPYLEETGTPDPEKVRAMVEEITSRGLVEPARFVLTSQGSGSHVVEGQILLAAAEQLGMASLPVRFSFTECAICEDRADSGHYDVNVMRERNDLDWVRDRFFKEMEFVFVDQDYPGKHDFNYHIEPTIAQMLEYFDGDADQAKIDAWKEKIAKGEGHDVIPVTFNYGAHEVEFGSKKLPSDEVHAMLLAAQDMGMERYPVLNSFQDQVTCRSGMQRTNFSAGELFADGRISVVKERFFDDRRRLIYDDAGRTREKRQGYPFGKNYPYHMMTQTDELYSYIAKNEMPDEEEVEKAMKEIQDKGVNEPIYLQLIRSQEKQEYEDRSKVLIVAAKRLGMERLPVRLLYINHPRRAKTVCAWLVRRVIEKFRVQQDSPEPSRETGNSGGEISPS